MTNAKCPLKFKMLTFVANVMVVLSLSSVVHASTEDQARVVAKAQGVRQMLAQKYPQVKLVDEYSYFAPDNAKKGDAIYGVLQQVISAGNLKPEIIEIHISTYQLGELKKTPQGLIAHINPFEVTKPGVWDMRLSANVSVGNACEAKPYSLGELRQFLANLRGQPSTQPEIPAEWQAVGLTLSQEAPSVIQKLKIFLALEYRVRSERYQGRIYAPEVLQRIADCDRFECIADRLFGSEEMGLLQLKILNDYGMNPSFTLDPEEYDNWDINSLRVVESAMRESSRLIFAIIQEENQKNPDNPAKLALSKRAPMQGPFKVLANASMVYFQHFLKLTPTEMKGYVMHELSHHLFDPISGNLGYGVGWPKWNNLSQWIYDGSENQKTWSHPVSENRFVSPYAGRRNPEEDFAETVRVYRYEPALLKAISPEKYQFIKNIVFDGIEFTSEQACHQPGISAEINRVLPEATGLVKQSLIGCETEAQAFMLDSIESSKEFFSLVPTMKSQARIEALPQIEYGAGLGLKQCFERNLNAQLVPRIQAALANSGGSLGGDQAEWLQGYLIGRKADFSIMNAQSEIMEIYLSLKAKMKSHVRKIVSTQSGICKQARYGYLPKDAQNQYFDTLDVHSLIKLMIQKSMSVANSINHEAQSLCQSGHATKSNMSEKVEKSGSSKPSFWNRFRRRSH